MRLGKVFEACWLRLRNTYPLTVMQQNLLVPTNESSPRTIELFVFLSISKAFSGNDMVLSVKYSLPRYSHCWCSAFRVQRSLGA